MTPEIGVRRLLARPGADPVAYDVILRIRDGRIAAIERAEDSARDQLAMPALVNAHDHGYGVRTLAFGGVDDALEPWIASLRLVSLSCQVRPAGRTWRRTGARAPLGRTSP